MYFEAAVKERWQWNDSRKNDSTKEFDRAIEGTYGPDAQSVYDYLEKVEVLLARVLKKKKAYAKINAVNKV